VRQFEHACYADAGTIADTDSNADTHPAAVADRLFRRGRRYRGLQRRRG
jgi:hypothetical protein